MRSGSAIEDYSNNIYYLEKKWNKKVIADFIDKADTIIEKIALERLRFKPADNENIFQVPVVK